MSDLELKLTKRVRSLKIENDKIKKDYELVLERYMEAERSVEESKEILNEIARIK